jgi:hypothetical protein
MKRNGTTSKGTTRWRCTNHECGSSRVFPRRQEESRLEEFLSWLFSKSSQSQLGLPARTFRDHTARYWDYWPKTPLVDEPHEWVHADGIHLGRNAVVLIAVDETGTVLGWHTDRSETTRAWSALFSRISPPRVLVCDGGSGIRKAMRQSWPGTRMQRCLFHVFRDVTVLTTRHPQLQAGKQLLDLAHRLLHATTQERAIHWLHDYATWEARWHEWLAETSTYSDGSVQQAHQRLVRARNMLDRRISEGALFEFLRPEHDHHDVPWTNNRIESLNAQLRIMLREHRGLSLIRRIKAIHWYCSRHTKDPLPLDHVLENCWTDQQITDLYQKAWQNQPEQIWALTGIPMKYGTGIQWNEFHT